ncbi:hypothetical protein SLE2022_147270 [Rubroshorea leprosula]
MKIPKHERRPDFAALDEKQMPTAPPTGLALYRSGHQVLRPFYPRNNKLPVGILDISDINSQFWSEAVSHELECFSMDQFTWEMSVKLDFESPGRTPLGSAPCYSWNICPQIFAFA